MIYFNSYYSYFKSNYKQSFEAKIMAIEMREYPVHQITEHFNYAV